jgi:hypothetical protein
MAYNNPGPSSDSAMYEDAEPKSQEKSEPDDKKESDGETTAVLPRSILAGKDFKPGEEIVLEIVSSHEDEVVVKYAEPKSEEKPMESDRGSMGGSDDSEMAGMYE